MNSLLSLDANLGTELHSSPPAPSSSSTTSSSSVFFFFSIFKIKFLPLGTIHALIRHPHPLVFLLGFQQSSPPHSLQTVFTEPPSRLSLLPRCQRANLAFSLSLHSAHTGAIIIFQWVCALYKVWPGFSNHFLFSFLKLLQSKKKNKKQ